MILHIDRADHISDFRLHLWFNDGTEGEIDLSDKLDGPIFEPLRDPKFFSRFRLEGHTVIWENGADFAPEYLHSLVHSAMTA